MDADKENEFGQQLQALEEKVVDLERELAATNDTCRELNWRLMTLANATIADPRYPYWTGVTTRGVPEHVRVCLEMLFLRMSDRIKGEPGLPAYISDLKGVPPELLRESGAPRRSDVIAAIRGVTGLMRDEQVRELLEAVRAQGMFRDMCEYMLE